VLTAPSPPQKRMHTHQTSQQDNDTKRAWECLEPALAALRAGVHKALVWDTAHAPLPNPPALMAAAQQQQQEQQQSEKINQDQQQEKINQDQQQQQASTAAEQQQADEWWVTQEREQAWQQDDDESVLLFDDEVVHSPKQLQQQQLQQQQLQQQQLQQQQQQGGVDVVQEDGLEEAEGEEQKEEEEEEEEDSILLDCQKQAAEQAVEQAVDQQQLGALDQQAAAPRGDLPPPPLAPSAAPPSPTPTPTSRPLFFARFTAGWMYASLGTVAASLYERERRYPEAVDLLQLLLGGNACLSRRGTWWMRLSINLEHLKQSDAALEVSEAALADPYVRHGDRLALQRRVLRLGKPPRRWKRPAWAAVVAAEPAEVRVVGRPLAGSVGSRNRWVKAGWLALWSVVAQQRTGT